MPFSSSVKRHLKEPEEITRLDQLRIEKVSFIQKSTEKFRDNYIIGQQMG